MRKKPGDEAFWLSFKFLRRGWDQRLADFNRFSNTETQSCYSCLVLQLHSFFLFFFFFFSLGAGKGWTNHCIPLANYCKSRSSQRRCSVKERATTSLRNCLKCLVVRYFLHFQYHPSTFSTFSYVAFLFYYQWIEIETCT